LATKLGIVDRIRFLGRRTDVARLLAAADIHCQPNLGPEPFGITFVEAMAAGLPIVTTVLGAAAEVVTPANGILVPPADAPALASALQRLISDPDLCRHLGDAGPSRARQLCDPGSRMEDLRQLLASHITRRSPSHV
jgi:glycosyltransferase involved in cell wall biosynthesis